MGEGNDRRRMEIETEMHSQRQVVVISYLIRCDRFGSEARAGFGHHLPDSVDLR